MESLANMCSENRTIVQMNESPEKPITWGGLAVLYVLVLWQVVKFVAVSLGHWFRDGGLILVAVVREELENKWTR